MISEKEEYEGGRRVRVSGWEGERQREGEGKETGRV